MQSPQEEPVKCEMEDVFLRCMPQQKYYQVKNYESSPNFSIFFERDISNIWPASIALHIIYIKI